MSFNITSYNNTQGNIDHKKNSIRKPYIKYKNTGIDNKINNDSHKNIYKKINTLIFNTVLCGGILFTGAKIFSKINPSFKKHFDNCQNKAISSVKNIYHRYQNNAKDNIPYDPIGNYIYF